MKCKGTATRWHGQWLVPQLAELEERQPVAPSSDSGRRNVARLPAAAIRGQDGELLGHPGSAWGFSMWERRPRRILIFMPGRSSSVRPERGELLTSITKAQRKLRRTSS